MESDKLPKVAKDEDKIIEAKVVEVLESVSLINTKRTSSGVDQSGTSREPSPPGPPVYRYVAINLRYISRVYYRPHTKYGGRYCFPQACVIHSVHRGCAGRGLCAGGGGGCGMVCRGV